MKFYFLGFGRFALTIFADFSLIFFKKSSFHIFQYTKKCTQNVCRFLFFIKIFRFQNFVAFHEKSSIFLFYKLSCKTTLISFFYFILCCLLLLWISYWFINWFANIYIFLAILTVWEFIRFHCSSMCFVNYFPREYFLLNLLKYILRNKYLCQLF